jgi:pyruvate,orthophosphate dikinase
MRDCLGGKGANLAEMSKMGIPVPSGFTIRCEVCDLFYKNNQEWPEGLAEEVGSHLTHLEETMGKKFGDADNPLLLSVRSGAAQSLPGMMDTILNLGMSYDIAIRLGDKTGNPRFAFDSFRRFIQMFANVAMNIPQEKFEQILAHVKQKVGADLDTDLSAEDLREVIEGYLKVVKGEKGIDFPMDPFEQLKLAITAVLKSWNNERCILYRQMNDIKGLLGTAVNVQAMVFGNKGPTSGTGVCFTRNPSDGENQFYGEYLMNAQGEDVVAGIRTPQPISTLEDNNAQAYRELVDIRHKLEEHYQDMQDIEFTIEDGELFILQTRNAKRTVFAWLRTGVEMVAQGLIDAKTAIERMPAGEFSKLFAPILDRDYMKENSISPLTQALNASPGGACGQIYFSAASAEKAHEEGRKVLLVRVETSPEDIGGMAVAEGVLTARGGMTSHAAVVARGMGCPCVCGASELKIDEGLRVVEVDGLSLKEGDFLSIDGFTGEVFGAYIEVRASEIVQVLNGEMKLEDSLLAQEYQTFMEMVDEIKVLAVRTNADTPKDTEMAVKFGAEGIGLTRTEHMFFDGDRIVAMRKMILSETKEERKSALARLLPIQRDDFKAMFKVLNGRPATIRLLDPPLHEFLPHGEKGVAEMARTMRISMNLVKRKVRDMKEENPMLGFRGCRLSIAYPEILDMQIRAIIEAAIEVQSEGIAVHPEIMIPLVGHAKELSWIKEKALATIDAVFAYKGQKVDYKLGTMIEVPRAALTADEVAQDAEFFSFGTNDLTQMTCGFSRDDSGKFLPRYVKQGIYEDEPFAVLDQEGVGKLMKLAIRLGREVRPDIKLGICGEHGGEPKTVKFCHDIGLNYVSCSPYRVPVARLAAAQAAL